MAKILIAEDDPIAQLAISKQVEKMGHVAFMSPNGKHALDTLMVNKGFEMLITDVMMPEMDGLELIRSIRKEQKFNELPILIISAYVGVKEIASFLKQGATIFLPKPISKEQLEKSIKKYLKT